jgi:glycosyltransferase involved in cell wall biosynthesis
MISIIIPVFNVEHCLRRCLDSVKAQMYADFEAILVDDGSFGSSGNICDEYAILDRRFSVVHQPHQGVVSTRNRGLDLAAGNYILLCR